ncbi:peptidase inhibitor 15-like isoform X1 [Mizuhopecten yessoensis]|uniref:peptidase inhibitor 15-like isoform X1 n=1 Tax=Mizuhopecten yessoensis TaxID=6573 RepID=UPI000B45F3AC|nr:peptidase inhibitor 15-like isoform X1 [Mizuhopecten yessoensis]
MAVLTYLMLVVCVGQIRGAMMDVRPYKTYLLNLHNDYRRKVQPPAANMQIMVWNETLSNEAASWIQRCNFEYQNRGRGENLAFNTIKITTKEYFADALKAWYDEKNVYRLGTQTCGSACHYTQMVWYKTTQVGCAMVTCPSLNAFGRGIPNAWYLGCFYDPKGNWIGENPYEPGTPCSQCLDGQSCDNNLCTGEGEEVCEDNESLCKTWQTTGECKRNPNYMTRHCRKSCGTCICTGK